MKPKKIQLIGVDLDGTLLNENKQFCDGAKDTLRRARERGIHIVPITGRPLKGIPAFIRQSDLFDYVITSNGAQIVDNRTGKSLYSYTIENKKCRRIIKILRGLDCMFEPFADGVGYAQPHIFEYYLKTFRGGTLEDYFFSSRVVKEDIEGLFSDGTRTADEFFVNCSDKTVRDKMTAQLDTVGGLQYCLLADRFLEITADNCDKGSALEAICRHLGIDIKDTVAFGDGENDLTFLAKAGTAIAMGNAFPRVKEKADIIVDTNDNNGVCKWIENYLSLSIG